MSLATNTNTIAAAEQLDKRLPAGEAPVATFARGLLGPDGSKVLDVSAAGAVSVPGALTVTGGIKLPATATAPSDTATADAWYTITVNGVAYRAPLYTP